MLLLLFFSFSQLSCSNNATSQTKEKEETEQSFVEKHGQLSVKGTSLIDKDGQVLILNGVSLGWHNWWPEFYSKETVAWLHSDWDCKLIRAAIGVDPNDAYIENPEKAMKCLYEVVDAAIANDMYVIIDWHSHTIKTEEAKEFFTKIATKYKDYPNIIYEIFNEPVEQSWEEVKAYSKEIINTIRKIDTKNIILVGSPHWDQDIHLVADNPLQGYDNIMYTVHFYAATHKGELRDRTDYALNKGIPVFISECASMEASGDGPIDHAEWQRWVDWMEKHQLSRVAWSVSSKDETCSMIKDKSSPVSNWKESDLKEWGQIVRKTLKENNKK